VSCDQGSTLPDPTMSLSDVNFSKLALEALERCRVLARFSEEPGRLTRTFPPPCGPYTNP